MSRIKAKTTAKKIKSRGIGGKVVRLKRKWHGRPVGTVLRPPAALRNRLVNDDIAEVIAEVAPAVSQETDVADPPETEGEQEAPRQTRKAKKDTEGE